MKKQELLDKIAPCSLMCHTCGAYVNGVISQSANQLLKFMEGVCEFHEKHSHNEVERFKTFYQELNMYSEGSCSGCREKEHCTCSIDGCFILECTKEHKIDFCGECMEFPCNRTRELFEEEVYSQWLSGNEEIKELGIEEFWEKNKEKPHYRAYISK